MEEIGLRNLFSSYKGFTKIKYDVYGFAKLLIFGRFLNLYSKCATIKQNDNYYIPILNNYNPDNVYDTLDFIFQNKDKIIRRINTNLVKKANRSPKIIYYDVTNFYFEIENPDDDILDENENVIQKGIRKKGICKEERKFLKKEYINKDTGELLNSSEIKPILDYDKIEAYKKSLGYYQIVTSEQNMAENEVVENYHGLTQIEEQFRIMKGTLETRPLYVHTFEHIEAHLLICLIVLVMIRIIQKRIISSNQIKIKEDMYWATRINGNRIQEALNKWQVDMMPNGLYRFMNIEQEDLKIILKAFDINIPKKLFTPGKLKKIKKNIQVFI